MAGSQYGTAFPMRFPCRECIGGVLDSFKALAKLDFSSRSEVDELQSMRKDHIEAMVRRIVLDLVLRPPCG